MAQPQTPSPQRLSSRSPLDRLNPNVERSGRKNTVASSEAILFDPEITTSVSVLDWDQSNSIYSTPQSTVATAYPGVNPAAPSTQNASQRLPDDLIWYLARNFIEHPRDLAHLSYACRRLYDLLDPARYRCDAEFVKLRELEAGQPGYYPPQMYITHRKTALGWACDSENITMARKAIKAALSVFPGYLDSRIAFQGQPLSIAIRKGNLDIVRALLEAGSFPDPIVKHKFPIFENRRGMSKEKEEPAQIMVGAYLLPDFYGFTRLRLNALGFCIWHDAPSLITELLALHTSQLFHVVPPLGNLSPLHLASLAKLTHVVEMLLARGYAKGVRSQYFCSAGPLHLAAASENNQEILGLLLDHGEDLRMGDKRGWTALDWAIEHKCVRNAQYLLEASRRRI